MGHRFWGLVLIALGLLIYLQTSGIYQLGLEFWPVVLTLLGVAMVWNAVSRHRPAWFGLGLGLWIGGIGLFDILNGARLTPVDGSDVARLGWPILLVAVGLSMLFGQRAWFHWNIETGGRVGDLRYGRERWTLEKDLHLSHGVGDVRLDLTTADIPAGLHHIWVNSAIGEVRILVPSDVTVRADASVSIGDLQVFGNRRGGFGPHITTEAVVPGADVELRLNARLGIGQIQIISVPVQRAAIKV